MNKVALLRDSEIGLIKCHEKKMVLKNNPISRYNYVISICNSEYSVNDGIEFKMMKESCIYSKLFPMMKSLGGTLFLTFILLFIPFINIALYLSILTTIICYFSALSVFNHNLKKTPDPFKNMIFSTEICESINNINWCFDIDISELEGLSLNQDIVSSLMLTNSQGKIKFMVYNNVFWNYYHEFLDYKQFHLGWLAYSTSIFLISGFFYYKYYELIQNDRN